MRSRARRGQTKVKLRWKILLVLVLTIAVAGLVLHLVTSRNKNALEKYKNQLLAHGEKLNYADLAPPVPPPASNGARPFLDVAPTLSSSAYSLPYMKTIAPGVAMVAWREETTRLSRRGNDDGWTNAWEQLAHDLEIKRQGVLGLQDALDSPVLFFDLDYSQGFATLLPHLVRLKQAEILTASATIGALHDGNYSQALTNLQMSVTLIQHYQTEPLLISHLVKIAMAQIAIGATWEMLQTDHWTDAQLAEMQSQWQGMDLFGPVEGAFAMERALGADTFKTMRKSYAGLESVTGGMPGSTSAGAGTGSGFFEDPGEALKNLYDRYPRYWTWKSSWSYEEELCNVQMLQDALEMFRKVKTTGAFVPAENEFRRQETNVIQLHAHAQAHFIVPLDSEDLVRNSTTKFADAEVARRMLVVAIALKRHQLRHGNYPAELSTLAPDLLARVPIDLMDGKPLRYRLQSNGTYLLYSVGEDGVDDGGDPASTEPATVRNIHWLKGRDIVWPRAATKAEVDAYYESSPPK